MKTPPAPGREGGPGLLSCPQGCLCPCREVPMQDAGAAGDRRGLGLSWGEIDFGGSGKRRGKVRGCPALARPDMGLVPTPSVWPPCAHWSPSPHFCPCAPSTGCPHTPGAALRAVFRAPRWAKLHSWQCRLALASSPRARHIPDPSSIRPLLLTEEEARPRREAGETESHRRSWQDLLSPGLLPGRVPRRVSGLSPPGVCPHPPGSRAPHAPNPPCPVPPMPSALRLPCLQFVKVPSSVAPSQLFNLLLAEWHLPAPNLVVSLVGEERPFAMKSWLRDILCKGLVKAAQSTGEAPGPGPQGHPTCCKGSSPWVSSRGAEGPLPSASPRRVPAHPVDRGLVLRSWGSQGAVSIALVPLPKVAPKSCPAGLEGVIWAASCQGQNQGSGLHFQARGVGFLNSLDTGRLLQRKRLTHWAKAVKSGDFPGLWHLAAWPPADALPTGGGRQPAGKDVGAPGTVSPHPTGAWILTSALRVGLARHIGQAVRDHSLASTSSKARVAAIGITSLGRVLHRQLLDDAQVSTQLRAPQPPGRWAWARQGPWPREEEEQCRGHRGSLTGWPPPPPAGH